MTLPLIPSGPGFFITPGTATAGTAITGLVPPWPGGVGGAPLTYDNNQFARPNWLEQLYTHLTTLLYTTGGTAHNLYFMRPLNFAVFATAVPKNTTAVVLDKDPGVFSTNFRYPLPGQQAAPALVADNVIAAADFVAYQLDDGVWQLDTIASGSGTTPTLTTGTPNRNGATIAAGRPFFWFGVKTDVVPQTGLAHPTLVTIASTNKINQLGDNNGAGFQALNPGDPIMLLSDNITAAGKFDAAMGYYARF